VQRAQSFTRWRRLANTVLAKPQMLKPVIIDVPRGVAKVFRNPNTGVVYAVVDSSFLISQLNTIIQLAGPASGRVVLALTMNVFPGYGSPISNTAACWVSTLRDAGQEAIPILYRPSWGSWVDQGIRERTWLM